MIKDIAMFISGIAILAGFLILGIPHSEPPPPARGGYIRYPIALEPLFYEWQMAVGKRQLHPLYNVEVQVVDATNIIEPEDQGSCNPDTHTITVWLPRFVQSTPLAQKYLIWHELGHCAYGLTHPDDPSEDTIMQHILPDVSLDVPRYEAEYFSRVKAAVDAAKKGTEK